MPRKYGTFSTDFLSAIGEATGFFNWPPVGSREWVWRELKGKKKLNNSLYQLKKENLVKQVSKNGKKFIRLTSKGELELLLRKALMDKPKVWDKAWRILIFDIPESSREKRDGLRALLKRNNFIKLQASVFISPYPLNREAIAYLKQSKLINYIRIIRANEIDDDRDLRKKFKLE